MAFAFNQGTDEVHVKIGNLEITGKVQDRGMILIQNCHVTVNGKLVRVRELVIRAAMERPFTVEMEFVPTSADDPNVPAKAAREEEVSPAWNVRN